MKMQEKLNEAIKLRKTGLSLKQINERLGIAKSTCSIWLKDVKLNEFALKRLKEREEQGRLKGRTTKSKNKVTRINSVYQSVLSNLEGVKLNQVQSKLLCSLLYWAEGSKKGGVRFINSDPEMIKTFLTLFRNSFTLNEAKFQASLHLHEYHNKTTQLKFWSKITNITVNKISVYLKPHTGKNTKENYPGCISIRYNDVIIFEEIQAYYKVLARQYGGVV